MTLTDRLSSDASGPESGRPQPEAGAFARIAALAHRRRRFALLLWVALMVGIWTAASALGNDYRQDFSLPARNPRPPPTSCPSTALPAPVTPYRSSSGTGAG